MPCGEDLAVVLNFHLSVERAGAGTRNSCVGGPPRNITGVGREERRGGQDRARRSMIGKRSNCCANRKCWRLPAIYGWVKCPAKMFGFGTRTTRMGWVWSPRRRA